MYLAQNCSFYNSYLISVGNIGEHLLKYSYHFIISCSYNSSFLIEASVLAHCMPECFK